jgi:hypothetical protein
VTAERFEQQVIAGSARLSSWMLVATTFAQVALVIVPGIRRIANGSGWSKLLGVGFVLVGVGLCAMWLLVLVRRIQHRRQKR